MFKKLFKKAKESSGFIGATGVIPSPFDARDIPLSAIQSPIIIPEEYHIDVSDIPVLNQRALGACVGHALASVVYSFEKRDGRNTDPSPRYLYAEAKKIDGYAGQGTYPRVALSILKNQGCATTNTVPNDTNLSHDRYINIPNYNDAAPRKIKAYAWVASTFDAVKQAFFQNQDVTLTFEISKGSYHYVRMIGYDKDHIYYRNSWGSSWGNKGNGKFKWNDTVVFDVVTIVDITEKQKEELQQIKWSNNFEKAVSFILKHEGGYVNDPRDPGGETKYGISKRYNPGVDIKNLTVEQAKLIYYKNYWLPIQGDKIPFEVALNLLDSAVNQGRGTATRLMQQAGGTIADGIIGPKSIAAFQKKGILKDFLRLRLIKYVESSNFNIYKNGWFTRAIDAYSVEK